MSYEDGRKDPSGSSFFETAASPVLHPLPTIPFLDYIPKGFKSHTMYLLGRRSDIARIVTRPDDIKTPL